MQQFTVIGAGLVGVCCALHLQREGFTVRLVDKGAPGMKASFGNSGSFGTASCVPFALPGVLKKVPKMLLDPTSPLKLRWGHVPKALPFFLRLVAASRPSRVEEIARARNSLLVHTHAGYAPLIEGADAGQWVSDDGLLMTFESEEAFAERGLCPRPAPAQRRAHGHPRRQRGAADGAGAQPEGRQGGVAARRASHDRSVAAVRRAGQGFRAARRRDRRTPRCKGFEIGAEARPRSSPIAARWMSSRW